MTLVLSFFLIQAQAQKLVTYAPPDGTDPAPEFRVEVNGEEIFVYNTRIAAFTYFSFEGKADIHVTFLSPVYRVDIRPASREIESEIKGSQVSFSLAEPANLSLEVNRNIKRPLFIFANPLEKDVPEKEDKNVTFYESGRIHEPGEVFIESNQTVYIEGGAIVRGHFRADRCNHVTISGRGILDNSLYRKGTYRPIEINRCEEVLVQGIILTESRHWSCPSTASRNVTYQNFKIVSENDWDDGIDIVGSSDVLVDNCFIRTKDDCIAIKAGVNYFTDFNSGFIVDNVVVQNSVLWNGAWGNALEIGFETRADTIRNIVFRNCDIIHVEGPEGTFTIHNGDRAVVSNVLYEDIRVEDARGWLIDFRILESRYSKDKARGKIEKVRFRGITVDGDHFPYSQIIGFDDTRDIENVVLEDFFIHGNKIESTYSGMIAVAHLKGLVFK